MEFEVYLQRYFGFAAQDLHAIAAHFAPLTLKKHSFYLREGEYAHRLGFLRSGMIREFLTDGEQEVTKWIATPGYFVVDLASFLFDRPARWNMQALADCELLVLDREAYEQIRRAVPGWAEAEKTFIARCFTVLEERVVHHLSLSAEQRYDALFAMAPELFTQVPLQYLASMLGMKPETLSRIRKKQSGSTS
ncbi:MAG: Crp/Fnr family transcriptional regulator [Bacteroidia bacterium]|nr:Crp/Fnr family transcriptional regulator [Bacteroidia bacterium]